MEIKCPRCKSKDYVKNGKMNKKQRYLCKECKYNFSSFKKRGKSKEIKKKAIEIYLEGLGFRSIGRILGVSNVAVLKWVRKTTENLRSNLKDRNDLKHWKIEKMELDEMWHYVLKKSKKHGYGLQLIDLVE